MKARGIEKVCNSLTNIRQKKLPVRMALILGRNLKKLGEALKDISEQRDGLIERYCDRDEDGNPIIENGQIRLADTTFWDDEKELYDIDIPIELEKISMADIERCDEEKFDSLTVDELSAMECMIE